MARHTISRPKLARILVQLTTACLAAVVVGACGGEDSGGVAGGGATSGGGAGGTAASAGSGATGGTNLSLDGGGGSSVGGSAGQSGDASCGATGIAIQALPPDMLVVFDRSCSMRRVLGSTGPVFGTGPNDPSTRWYMAVNALDQIMTAYENKVRFGLLAFPAPLKGCGDSPPVNVMPDIGKKTAILGALAAVQPFDVCLSGAQPQETPTQEALLAVASSNVFKPAERDGFVLLMTDGGATCGATPQSLGQAVQALATSGIKTAVVGFGDVGSQSAIDMLNSMGQAGGFKSSAPWYWLAQQPTDLLNAIQQVVNNVVSCKFKLSSTPPDPKKLYAYFDGQSVPEDSNNGWSYDGPSVTVEFHGSACKQLQDGKVKNVSIVFGCPDPSCIPSTEVCDGYDNDCDGQVDESCVQ